MGHNSDLIFDQPQPVLQVAGQIQHGEDIFGIQVTGPERLVAQYIEEAPLQLRMLTEQEAEAIIETVKEKALHEQKESNSAEAMEEVKPPPLARPTELIEIDIHLVSHDSNHTVLFLEEDPDLAWHGERRYYLNGASRAWATCSLTFGDADLYLDEERPGAGWELRQSSLQSGINSDSVDQTKIYSGNWRLRVYGYRASTYSLTGVFPQSDL